MASITRTRAPAPFNRPKTFADAKRPQALIRAGCRETIELEGVTKQVVCIEAVDLIGGVLSRVVPPGVVDRPPLRARFLFRVERDFATARVVLVRTKAKLERDERLVQYSVTVDHELRASVQHDAQASILGEFAKVNAIQVIVPYIREAIAALTMRTGYPPMVLPPLGAKALLELADSPERW